MQTVMADHPKFKGQDPANLHAKNIVISGNILNRRMMSDKFLMVNFRCCTRNWSLFSPNISPKGAPRLRY